MTLLQSLMALILSAPTLSVLFATFTIVMLALVVLTVAVIPSLNRSVREARKKAEHILVDAHDEARALRMSAQAEAEKVFTDRKADDEQLRLEQVKHLAEVTQHAKELLSKQTVVIAQLCEDMANDFKKQTLTAEKMLSDQSATVGRTLVEADEHLKQALADVVGKVQQDYKTLTDTMKQRLSDELEKEITAARKAVVAYKQERLAGLERDIVRLVEDTARIALHTSLSLDDHRGIILAALAEAKQAGVFSTPV